MTEMELVQRLERLERDNRRLKRLGAAALTMAAALGAIYATRPAPEKVTAREFDLVDSSGALRAQVGTTRDGGSQIILSAGSKAGYVRIANVPSVGAGVEFSGPGNKGWMDLVVGPDAEPNIELNDPHGFKMDLGSTRTVAPTTGQTQQTSAASIVMFGNDEKHKVIWKAP